MVQPVSAPQPKMALPGPSSRVASMIVVAAVVLAVALVAAAAALWAHYGSAVFFEMIKSGIAACI